MKKRFAVVAVASLAAGIIMGAGFAGQKPITLIVNGMTQQQWPLQDLPAPRIVDGHVMIPAASLTRTYREDVEWNGDTRSIEINPDVWQAGGFGYKAADWPKARNVIYRYLLAVQEPGSDPAAYVSPTFKSDAVWDGVAVMDIQFRDGKENETTYTVRVATVNYYADQDTLFNAVSDYTIDKETLKIVRIASAPGGGRFREYTVLPGIELITQMEG
ncbi:hypothetical protein I8J29_15845 [Paenibacillus sp. MWE-103]|uniref:Copper amine oxidase-like protein n=1 Tax=Paenibacillus artemisiicola TaxID=1172618 RepID=A0ABS3WBJ5_9BACL|nr:hypothetical protein [Paenibacillus artemisiicola]MBO7745684.1 hypothetical protein [Paenibacillus artemisiicola]